MSLLLHIRTRWQRYDLDERLAAGAVPAVSPELELRAGQLMSTSERERIASGIEQSVAQAVSQWPPAAAQFVPLGSPQIRECAPELLAIALRLRDDEPVDVRGVAMASQLLSDGAGPLYRDGRGDLLHRARSVRLTLDASAPVAGQPELASAA
ncbi:MAG: hypothetical protein ACJ77G_15560 [Solirubrobacteraceae bacterium]